MRGWGVRENLFQVSLLASAGFLATFGLHWLTDTEPLASFILTWSVRVCFQMSPFVRIQVMLAENQANDFILTNYIVFPNRVTAEGTGGEDAHITWRGHNLITPSQHQGPVGGERARKTEGKRVDCGVWACGCHTEGFPGHSAVFSNQVVSSASLRKSYCRFDISCRGVVCSSLCRELLSR